MPNFPALPTSNTRDNVKVTVAANAAFLQGALLVLTAGVAAECGANPATISHIAAEPGPGSRLTLTGANAIPDNVSAIAHRVTEFTRFWMQVTSDGTAPATPQAADVGATFGVTKGTDGIWTLDRSKNAANQRVYVHSIDTVRNLAEVSVLAANRQTAP